jgi:hypothetical protein
MHAIAFICANNNQGIEGAIVSVYENAEGGPANSPKLLGQGITNQDGYVLFNYMPNDAMVEVFVVCAGYRNYFQQMTLGDSNINYNISLTPSFKKPSRDRIINVKANLCNLYDADNNPIFEPMINWLVLNNPPKAFDWVKRAKDAGSTHYNLAIACNYRNNPVPGTDFTQDLATFSKIIDWIKAQGLVPIVKLAMDGQRFDPNGLTYGWQWGMDNIERIADGLSKHNDSVLWSTGFDGCFPDWNPNQTIQMLRKMRAVLGNSAQIDTEFAGPPGAWGYIHMGNGGADWAPDKLGILDHFSLEAEAFPIQVDGEGSQEIATRLLGPNCLIGPQTPYYLAGLNKYIAIDVYETVATWFYNGRVATSQDAIDAANGMTKWGFKCFGNGVPTILY